jgi:WS/DGAT/MGAT family acyltransferase
MLDRGKPLWQMTFIEGLEGGRVGLVQKTHHGLIDGVTSMDMMSLLFDAEPNPDYSEPPPWAPSSPPDPADLAQEAFVAQAVSQATGAGPYGLLAQQTAEQAEQLTRGLASMSGLGPLPETSLNQELGPRRRYDWYLTTLAAVKGLRALVPGSTVNDIMIAAITAALRALLQSRGEAVDGLQLRAFVPVSLRDDSDQGGGAGNRVSGFIVPLPVGESDAVRRLEAVHRSTRALKEDNQAVAIDFLTKVQGFAPPMLMAQAGREAMQQSSFVNLTITNVPGPQQPLYLMGARLLELHPMVLNSNRLTLNVAIMSYNGALSIGLCSDYDANPDLDVVTKALETSLTELADAQRAADHNPSAT